MNDPSSVNLIQYKEITQYIDGSDILGIVENVAEGTLFGDSYQNSKMTVDRLTKTVLLDL